MSAPEDFKFKIAEPDTRLFDTVERLAKRLGVEPCEPGGRPAIYFHGPGDQPRKYSFEDLWTALLDRMDVMAERLDRAEKP